MDLPNRALNDLKQDRRLKEALRYVCRTWIPINSTLLATVQAKSEAGAYDNDPKVLLRDLKRDFALFGFCLRKIGELNPQATTADPLQAIKNFDGDKLREILSASESEISTHRLDDIKQTQAARIKHSLISCTTAELLAQKTSFDPNQAFLCAMLRQLGHALVAWNYQSSFAKALTTLSERETDFDGALKRVLGFSPELLGYKATVDWCVGTGFRKTLDWNNLEMPSAEQAKRALSDSSADNEQWDEIARFCEIGEGLAKVNDPEHYPAAASKWKDLDKDVKHYLGPKGFSLINDRIKESIENYQSFAPKLLTVDVSPEQILKKSAGRYGRKLYDENPYLKQCPDELRERFKAVYGSLLPGQVSIEAVGVLISNVIPAAGFTRGCVYVIDNNRMVLVPRLRIGDVNINIFKQHSCSCGGERSHPISEALHCSTPLREENVILNGDIVSHVSGKFGNSDKAGVLYLEMSERLLDGERHVPILYFKAIRKCLDDCLNLH